MNGGVDRVVVKTSKTERLLNLFEIIHDLGKAFFCKVGKDTFKLSYFSQHTQGFFEGSVSDHQLA